MYKKTNGNRKFTTTNTELERQICQQKLIPDIIYVDINTFQADLC